MADVQLQRKADGSVNLNFTSHGRQHRLELTESNVNLSALPLRLVGSSRDREQEVVEQLKVSALAAFGKCR